MSKEKQIEEMVKVLCRDYGEKCGVCGCKPCAFIEHCKALYNAGYRKHSEGEWETIPDYQPDKLIAYRHICSVCKTVYKDIRSHGHKYCHECGAKMKGGAE